MKTIKYFISALFFAAIASACTSGDHSTRSGGDSVMNSHQTPSSTDTSAITTKTGGASNIDDQSSGGTKGIKDTTKVKSDSTKK